MRVVLYVCVCIRLGVSPVRACVWFLSVCECIQVFWQMYLCVCVHFVCIKMYISMCLYRDIYIMHMYFLRTYPCVGAYIFMYKGWVVQRGFMYVGGEVPICYICKGIHVTECVNETHRISTLITKINYFSISILVMINTRGAQNF